MSILHNRFEGDMNYDKMTNFSEIDINLINLDNWSFFTSPFPKERHTSDNIRMELRRRL